MKSKLKSIFIWSIICAVCVKRCEQATVVTDPLITSWIQCTGYGAGNGSAYLANVQTVAYDSSYIYIKASGIPSYR